MILYRKNLHYRPAANITIVNKVISFIVVISLAYTLESYWALIITTVFSAAFLCFGTYFVSSYRPKFNTAKIREQLRFSQWIFYKSLVGFLRSQVDMIIASKLFQPNVLGGYHITRYIASIPSSDIIVPLIEPLLSSFSSVNKNMEDLRYQLTLSLIVIFAVTVPITFFLLFFSEAVVLVLLGEKWVAYSPVLSAISGIVVTFAVGGVLSHMCVAMGKPSILFFYNLSSLVLMGLVFIAISGLTIEEFATLKMFLDFFIVLLLFLYVGYLLKYSFRRLLIYIIPVFLSSFIIGYWLKSFVLNDFKAGLLGLLISSLLFFFLYLSVMYVSLLVIFRKYEEGRYLDYLIRLYWKKILVKARFQ